MHRGGQTHVHAFGLPAGQGRWIALRGQRKALVPEELDCHCRCSTWNGIGPLEHISGGMLLSGWCDWEIVCDDEDLPLGDGAASFANAPLDVPLLELPVPGIVVNLKNERGGFLKARPANHFCVHSEWMRSDRVLESWTAQGVHLRDCCKARTFISVTDYCMARAGGLLAGCDLGQGRLLGPARTAEEFTLAMRLGVDPMCFDWSLEPPRMDAECAAHKVLDLVGDLGLWLGILPCMEIEMCNVGHAQFHELGRRLFDAIRVPDDLSRRVC